MLSSIYLAIWATGLVSTLAAFGLQKHHTESVALAGFATVSFGVVALTGSVDVVTDSGAIEAIATTTAQLVGLVLAGGNALAFTAGLVGAWPVGNREEAALDALERTRRLSK